MRCLSCLLLAGCMFVSDEELAARHARELGEDSGPSRSATLDVRETLWSGSDGECVGTAIGLHGSGGAGGVWVGAWHEGGGDGAARLVKVEYNLTLEVVAEPQGPSNYDALGHAVLGIDQGDGDPHAVLGLSGYNVDDNGDHNEGAVAIVDADAISEFDGDLTLEGVTLISGEGAPEDGTVGGEYLGATLADAGPIDDGSGAHAFWAAAPDVEAAAINSTYGGSVYLVADPDSKTNIADAAQASWSGEEAGDALGAAIATGDLNCEGTWDAVIGAMGAGASGQASILLDPLDNAVDQGLMANVADATYAPDGAFLFGASAAIGDLDGDGCSNNFAVGAPGTSDGAGAVYVYADEASDDEPVIVESEDEGDGTGWAVAIGDWDGDGFDDLFVGSPGADDGVGAIHLFYGPLTADTGLANADLSAVGDDASYLGAPLVYASSLVDQQPALVAGAPGTLPWSLDCNGPGEALIFVPMAVDGR